MAETLGSEFKSSGVTEKTPGNIPFGAGTIHKGLKFDSGTKKWNFAESLVGATSGGSKFEIAPEVAEFSHKDNTYVDCHAKCLFNKNGKCNANGITVLEDSEKGFCGTYIEE